MLRQRIRLRSSAFALIGEALLVLVALALVWYGLMVVLLALEVDPGTVNAMSAYRDIYDFLAGLSIGDVDWLFRLIAGLAGLATFLFALWLAWKELPRPYLARSDVPLRDDEQGVIIVRPRAVERAAEVAATEHPDVTSASGRYESGGLAIEISVRRARELPETLRDVQRRVRETLDRHELPSLPVTVTLTGFDRKTRRELE